MIAPQLAKLFIWNWVRPTRRQTDAAIDYGGPALEQHCDNVSRRPYSQPRALQCLSMYTYIYISVLVRALSISHQCRIKNPGQHRTASLFAIEYFNENTVYIHNIC